MRDGEHNSATCGESTIRDLPALRLSSPLSTKPPSDRAPLVAQPWAFVDESAPLGRTDGLVTLVEGSAFALSGTSGDMYPDRAQGVFFFDRRMLSQWVLTVNGQLPEPLTAATEDPFAAVLVSRVRLPDSRGTLVVLRRRYVGNGMRETIEVRNHALEPHTVEVALEVDTDLADLFDVKEGRFDARRRASAQVVGNALCLSSENGDAVEVSFDIHPTRWDEPTGPQWEMALAPGQRWSLCTEVALVLDGDRIEVRHPCGLPVERALPMQRLTQWRRNAPVIESDNTALRRSVDRAVEDLGALRIFDPGHPERQVVAAGAPWFMTLFGRDSLLASWMALIVDPALAEGVVETLAGLQGTEEDPETEEQPGRILHEVRFGRARSMSLGDGHIYYGTADATPLFVMLLGELRRWGIAGDTVARLLPHVDRALQWIDEYGDRDGDGYVEYERSSPSGLEHQGWKDSWDGVCFADGTPAEPPIALCEVQAYTYSAYVARAHFALEEGEMAEADRWTARAADLKTAFNRDFWLEDEGRFALGLDADKRAIDALASNVGHCLWAGIVDQHRAPMVAEALLSSEMFTGWGVRTLGSSMAAYDPLSYHNGSVWPHDSALIAAGLMRYGFVEEAHRIVLGLLDAASAFDGRLPELYAGLPRAEVMSPVEYPTSCSPQAWAAAVPLLCLRTLLRFDPSIPDNRVYVAPVLPEGIARLSVEGIPLGDTRVTVHVEHGAVDIEGLPSKIQAIHSPYPRSSRPTTEK